MLSSPAQLCLPAAMELDVPLPIRAVNQLDLSATTGNSSGLKVTIEATMSYTSPPRSSMRVTTVSLTTKKKGLLIVLGLISCRLSICCNPQPIRGQPGELHGQVRRQPSAKERCRWESGKRCAAERCDGANKLDVEHLDRHVERDRVQPDVRDVPCRKYDKRLERRCDEIMKRSAFVGVPMEHCCVLTHCPDPL